MTALEQLRALARYQTHGGYTWGAVMADGELLCTPCVRANYRLVFGTTKGGYHDSYDEGWECIGIANSGDSEETEHCAQCSKVIWEHESGNLETVTATAPSAWASYLINGDDSGIEESDVRAADAFCEFVDAGSPVDCADAGFVAYCDARNWGMIDCAADCQTYTFLKRKEA